MKIFTIVLSLFMSIPCYSQQVPTCISQPVHVNKEGLNFKGSENLLLVPENRAKPQSRMIGLHFFHFPAKEPSNLPPVVFLGAGPGEPYAVEHFYEYYHGSRAKSWVWELNFVNQKRDLILINQRGNPDAPGLVNSELEYRWRNGSFEEPFDLKLRNENRKIALEQQIQYFEEMGMDLAGYDIVNFVEDIESVRSYFKYEKLAFIGNSFGSQWGLAYIQSYPEHCDRGLFSGVEPLDHTYDDPQGIWAVLEQVEAYAQADSSLNFALPAVGLLGAFKEIMMRLEEAPVAVKLVVPLEEIDETVLLGPDDFRMSIMNPFANGRVDAIESWPKYITELYNGDYRTLALRSRGRGSNSSSLMMAALVDNSLGITAEREALLDNCPAAKWLGDVNMYYKETRKVRVTPDVGDDFRSHKPHDIPILLIQGDMDKSTPYGNALFLMDFLKCGHLITVKRGTHTAKRAMILSDMELGTSVYEFMNIDFEHTDFDTFRATLPKSFELPEFEFWPIEGESLFERYINE